MNEKGRPQFWTAFTHLKVNPTLLLIEMQLKPRVHRSLKLLNDSIFVQPAAIYSLFHGFSLIRTAVAPSLSLYRLLVPKQFARAGHANRLFSSYTEDIFSNNTRHIERIRCVILRRCAI